MMNDVLRLPGRKVIDCVRQIIRSEKNNRLFLEFENFLIEGNHMMKFYEEEVISVPVGRTFDLVKKFGVYICPNTRSNN